jgi:hypothetical protein
MSMTVELSGDDIETLLTSLKYSQRAIADAQGTPYEVRQQNLARVEAVAEKLRKVRGGESPP